MRISSILMKADMPWGLTATAKAVTRAEIYH